MSAPDTNTDKQEKQHRPSLIGVRGAIVFAVLILLGVVGINLINAPDDPPAIGVTTDPDASDTNSNTTPAVTN